VAVHGKRGSIFAAMSVGIVRPVPLLCRLFRRWPEPLRRIAVGGGGIENQLGQERQAHHRRRTDPLSPQELLERVRLSLVGRDQYAAEVPAIDVLGKKA